jgi:hypothetical protein
MAPNLYRQNWRCRGTAPPKLSGRFIPSLNDAPEIRRLFASFMIEPVAPTYSVGAAEGAKNRPEPIIANADFSGETAKIRTKSKWRATQNPRAADLLPTVLPRCQAHGHLYSLTH